MADDRHYVGGDNYLLDDISGFKIRASKARIIPGGQTGNLAVAPQRWEPQQPQDFVRGVADDQSVALSRPRQQNRFVIVGTFVTAPSARGTGVITVDSPVGFQINDNILLMLDSGENFLTSVAGIVGKQMFVGTPLPYSVGTLYGDPIENSVLFLQHGPPLVTGFYSDGGVLAIIYPSLLPTSSSTPGAVYDNGGVVAIVPGVGPGTAVMVFNQISQGYLIQQGGGQLPASPGVTNTLWNNGGEIAIA